VKKRVLVLAVLFMLLLGSIPVFAATINVQTPVVRPGEDIVATFSAADGGSAWIGLFKSGSANTSYLNYSYLRNLNGEYKVKAPKELGSYNLRIFLDSGYTLVTTSQNLQVVQYDPVFQVSKASFLPEETIVVNYSDAPVFSNAWIGLFKVGAEDRSYLNYQYLTGTSGSYSTNAPRETGQYEFRIFLDSGYTLVGKSQPFTVSEFQPSISLSTYQARPGQKVTATYNNGSTISNAWIGFYKQDSANTSYISYVYTRGQTTGTYEITTPNTPGQYNFRIFMDSAYNFLAASGTLSVGDVPAEPVQPTEPQPATPVGFSDLAPDHWAYNDIMEMVGLGILSGYPDGTFRPNDTISRAEFAKIMVLTLQLETIRPSTPTFDDVSTDHWAYEVVESAREYLTGYRDSAGNLTFAPGEVAVREDVAVAIVKAQGYGDESADLTLLNQFPDREEISASLREHVAIAVEKGYMRGTDRGFEPQKALTRAEACTLLSRIMDRDLDREKITF